MKQVTIRQTSAELPLLLDEAELARVESLGAEGGSLSRFELAGTRVRALDVKDVHLVDGRVRAVRAGRGDPREGAYLREAEFHGCDLASSLFDHCDLALADFGPGGYRGCDLRGNDLSAISGAHHLSRVVIDRAQLPQLAESLAAELEVSFGDDLRMGGLTAGSLVGRPSRSRSRTCPVRTFLASRHLRRHPFQCETGCRRRKRSVANSYRGLARAPASRP
jgi:hypothetical protein